MDDTQTPADRFDGPWAGDITFARCPRRDDPAGVDIAVLGIPFDLGTTNRPGARFGPRAIREQSLLVGEYPWGLWPWKANPLLTCVIIDAGDVPASFFWAGYPQRMVDAVVEHASRFVSRGVTVLGLGGDHATSYPLLRATAAKHGKLSLIHFDSHTDTWAMGDDFNHGTPFRRAAVEELVDPDRSVQVGIRTPNPDTMGFNIIDADRLLDDGVAVTSDAIRAIVGDRAAYITFDIDFLDPAYAPGTGTPVIGGPTTAQARRLLRGLAGLRIVGADVVEVAPAHDPTGHITALAGATLALDLVHLLALARAARGTHSLTSQG
jgi:agmatinase